MNRYRCRFDARVLATLGDWVTYDLWIAADTAEAAVAAIRERFYTVRNIALMETIASRHGVKLYPVYHKGRRVRVSVPDVPEDE